MNDYQPERLRSAALIGFFLMTCSLYGQITQTYRYEKELKGTDNMFHLVSMKEEGIALVREKNKLTEGKRLWELTLLDTLLKEVWATDVPMETQFRLIGYDHFTNHVYLLFREGEVDSNNLLLWQLNLTDHTVQKFDIRHQFNLKLTHFNIVGRHAIFGGYVTREPAVLLYEMNDLNDNRVKVVPGFFLTDTELLDLRVNVNNTFNALLMERNGRDRRKLSVRTFDESGTLLLQSDMEIEAGKTIITGQTSSLERDELLVLGTYGEFNGKQSAGYFSAVVDPYKQSQINYFDFASLNHLLDYLSPKRAEKIKAKSKRAIEAKKMPDFRLYVHPLRIQETGQGFFFLSEIYVPSTNYNTYPYWNNYYNPYMTGYGYYPYGFNSPMNRYYTSPYNNNIQNGDTRVVETVVTLFNHQGRLIWDHSLKLNEIRFGALEQAGDFVLGKDKVTIAYKKDEDINVKSRFISDDTVEDDTVKIRLLDEADILRHEARDEGGLRSWYGRSFYVWGYESVRNKETAEDPVRYVFYINEIKAD